MEKAEGKSLSNLKYALETVSDMYAKALASGHDSLVCQLTNDNRGFSFFEIEAVKQRLCGMTFDIPTHISILPVGKQPSNHRLFDGLVEIYCNSPELQQVVEVMKRQTVRTAGEWTSKKLT